MRLLKGRASQDDVPGAFLEILSVTDQRTMRSNGSKQPLTNEDVEHNVLVRCRTCDRQTNPNRVCRYQEGTTASETVAMQPEGVSSARRGGTYAARRSVTRNLYFQRTRPQQPMGVFLIRNGSVLIISVSLWEIAAKINTVFIRLRYGFFAGDRRVLHLADEPADLQQDLTFALGRVRVVLHPRD